MMFENRIVFRLFMVAWLLNPSRSNVFDGKAQRWHLRSQTAKCSASTARAPRSGSMDSIHNLEIAGRAACRVGQRDHLSHILFVYLDRRCTHSLSLVATLTLVYQATYEI